MSWFFASTPAALDVFALAAPTLGAPWASPIAVMGRALVAAASVIMAGLFFRLARARRRSIPERRLLNLIAAFLCFAALRHLMGALALLWNLERTAAAMLFIEGLLCLALAHALVRAMPTLKAMASPLELRRIVRERTRELAEANARLRETQERFVQLADAMPLLVWTTGPDGRVDFCNSRWSEFAGFNPADGKEQWSELLHPDDRERSVELWEHALRTRSLRRIEVRLKDGRTGEWRWHLARACPAANAAGEVVGWFGSCTDIDDQKRTEQALRESEQKLRLIIETTPHLVWSMTPEGKSRYASPQWLEYTGYSTFEDLDREWWNNVLHPDDRDETERLWRLALETKAAYETQYRLKRRDGVYRWFRVRGQALDAPGELAGCWFGTCVDIDDQKRAEERLRSVVDHVVDGIVSIDESGIVQSFNPAAERIFGFRAAEIVGRDFRSLFVRAERGRAPRLQGSTSEYLGRRRDGALFPIELAVSDFTLNGRYCMTGIVRDVTERVAAEQALRESEEKFRRIVETANEGIWILNERAEIAFVNPRMAEMLGYSAEEMIGRLKWDFVPAEDIAEVQRLWDRRRGGLGDQVDLRFLTKTGEFIWLLMAARAITDEEGAFRGGLDLFTDITARKLAEERVRTLNESLERGVAARTLELASANAKLAESEQRFRGAFDAAPVGMVLVDPEGKFLRFNRTFLELAGRSEDELEGLTFADITHPDDVDAYLDLSDRLLRGEISSFQLEERCLRKDEGVVLIVLSVSAVCDGSGRPLYCVGLLNDITARKRAEDELTRARDQAMAAVRAKGEFLANMSHEIRTPMNGVMGMTELLLDTPLNHEQREFAETTLESCRALIGVINDILDFSRIEAGKLELHDAPFNPREVVEEVTELLAVHARGKGLDFGCSACTGTGARLLGDPFRIRQVLTNLVGNAIKFTDSGEVRVQARIESDSETMATLRLEVVDTGIGIPEERQAEIFESFTRLESDASRSRGGTGLGLAICRKLVGLMGGEISLSSLPGSGSCFVVRLPLRKSLDEALPLRPDLAGLRFLIVDAEEARRPDLAATLTSWGCRIVVAAGERQSLAEASRSANDPFRAVMIDESLLAAHPELAETLCRGGAGRDPIPLVPLAQPSGLGPPSPPIALAAAPPLARPFHLRRIERVIRSILGLGESQSNCDRFEPIGRAHDAPPSILLAEDNRVNRRVAKAMLERMGCFVDLAANGREAIDRLDRSRHRLIIMDLQMPVMDGLAATAAIRGSEAGFDKRIPIIALTAHAMKGDLERCLSGGMDDYLTKPLDPAKLREVVARWLGEPAPFQDAPDPPEPDDADSASPLAIKTLRTSCGDDSELIREVVRLLHRDVPARLARLAQAIAEPNRDRLRIVREAHGLKGAFLMSGANRLALLCRKFELDPADDPARLQGLLADLKAAWIELRAELEILFVAREAEEPALV